MQHCSVDAGIFVGGDRARRRPSMGGQTPARHGMMEEKQAVDIQTHAMPLRHHLQRLLGAASGEAS